MELSYSNSVAFQLGLRGLGTGTRWTVNTLGTSVELP